MSAEGATQTNTLTHISSIPCLSQRFSRAINRLDDAAQRLGSIGSISIIERLAKIGQWLRRIARVSSWRINLVYIPGAPAKSRHDQKRQRAPRAVKSVD